MIFYQSRIGYLTGGKLALDLARRRLAGVHAIRLASAALAHGKAGAAFAARGEFAGAVTAL